MVFSSLTFLCIFLPIVVILYGIFPVKWRNFLLLAASLVFYAWGELRYILIMLFSTVFDYINGRLIEYYDKQQKQKAKKRVVMVSIVGNLGILAFFKYTDMLIVSWNQITASNLSLLKIALPIGISFYTFQTMSYTIDVYRGLVKAQRNLISFGMYVCMFPQLIAGPIVRYQTIADQIDERKENNAVWVAGMQRFILGLAKKVILANQIGRLWEEISTTQMAQLSTAGAWLGAIAYTFQIYFDFSGYSDMAIGLGKMFGFTFPENFKHPYESKSITEFWRRWHITLSTWFREYVYIPLGGNRKGLKRQIVNLLIVWFLTGLWHGASWNFVLWGLYYFVLLVIEKVFLLAKMQRWPRVLQHFYALFFIVTGWVVFAIEDFHKMGQYLLVMFGLRGSWINNTAQYQWWTYAFFLMLLMAASTTICSKVWNRIRRHMIREEADFVREKGLHAEFILKSVISVLLLAVSLAMLVAGSFNPFLYFRF